MSLQDKITSLNGWQRLIITVGVLWFIFSFIMTCAFATDFLLFFVLLILFTIPIWLVWLIVWIVNGFKKDSSLPLSEKINFSVIAEKGKVSYDNISAQFKNWGDSFRPTQLLKSIVMLLKDSWNGRAKLWKIYWLIYFPISIANRTIEKVHFNDAVFTESQAIASLIFSAWWMAITIWCVVALWRCAYNVKHEVWGNFVRFICILNLLFIAFAIIEFIRAFF